MSTNRCLLVEHYFHQSIDNNRPRSSLKTIDLYVRWLPNPLDGWQSSSSLCRTVTRRAQPLHTLVTVQQRSSIKCAYLPSALEEYYDHRFAASTMGILYNEYRLTIYTVPLIVSQI